jgi:hypothetical protein
LKLLLIPILLVLITTSAFGALSDATGLVNRLDVDAGGYTLEVKVVANFDVIDHEFVKDEKRFTIFIDSGLENNLGEIIIPKILLDGNFTFYLNDIQLNQKIKSNDRISFITLNFTGVGNNKIDIIATKTITDIEEKTESLTIDDSSSEGGGCLIATATYGTELAPQVQYLREIRDQKLMNTEFGASFMNSFNKFYYSVSPYIADYERENLIFKEIVKLGITPMISSLSILNYVEMDSEESVLGYGISLIILNLGMYVGIPASVIVIIRKHI